MAGLPEPPPMMDSPFRPSVVDTQKRATAAPSSAPAPAPASAPASGRRGFQDPSLPVPRTTFYADADLPPSPSYSIDSPVRSRETLARNASTAVRPSLAQPAMAFGGSTGGPGDGAAGGAVRPRESRTMQALQRHSQEAMRQSTGGPAAPSITTGEGGSLGSSRLVGSSLAPARLTTGRLTATQPAAERLSAASTAGSVEGEAGATHMGDGRASTRAQPRLTAEGVRASAAPAAQRESVRPPLGAPTANVVSEREFIGDVLFTWTGAPKTTLFDYDETAQRYVPDGLSERQMRIFDKLGDVGALVRQLEALLRSRSLSFLQQSLKAAINKQLVECARFVGDLREHADELTIAKMRIAHMKIQPKLTRLLRVLRETENTKGGDLATKLQVLNHQGSRRMAVMLSDIYIEAVSPLLHMTLQWITAGDVPDPYHEFFISVSDAERDTDDSFWSRKFSLRHEMLPATFQSPEGFAEKILLVGKNINFIRRCCRAKDWRMEQRLLDMAQQSTFQNISQVVEEALHFTNSAAMHILHSQFKLQQTLTLLHQFMLVSNATFFEQLVMRLEAVLSRPSTSVQQSAVRDQVHATIQETTPYLGAVDIEAVHTMVAHVDSRADCDGWEGLILSFTIPPPLNNIFDRSAMVAYRTLFRMLFKVKRAEVALKLAWRQSVALERHIVCMRGDDQDALAFRDVALVARLLGLELTHFINNLRSYLVTEVTTAAWERLVRNVASCTSLDELRDEHRAYLGQLELYTLVHRDCAAAKSSVDAILRMTRRFCVALSAFSRLVDTNAGDVFAIKAEMQHIADDYHREISALLTTLEDQHLQFDFLNFLLLRLNFNNFYHTTQENFDNTEF